MASLTVIQHGRESDHINFEEEPVTIGRGQSCEIMLPDDDIAGKHCGLVKIENEYYVKDLSQGIGLTINGEKTEYRKLLPGDVIEIGQYRIIFINTGKRKGIPHPVLGNVDMDKTMDHNVQTEGEDIAKDFVLVLENKKEEKEIRIEKLYYLIGTSFDCEIGIKGWGIAHKHAVIVRGKYDLRLFNLAGKGVHVNEELVDARKGLKPGDIIEIGPNRITVSIR